MLIDALISVYIKNIKIKLIKLFNDDIIGEADLNDVVVAVITLNASYYSIGRALGLPAADLDAIKSTCSQNLKQGLNDVILAWLRQKYDAEKYGPPTWRRLVEAVDDPAGGDNHALAKTIASHHPAGS